MNFKGHAKKTARRLLTLALAVLCLVPLVACSDEDEAFSYKDADLSEYISLDLSVFEGKKFDISLDKTVTDEEFEEEFNNLLLAYGPTVDVTDVAAKDGDTVKIYYKGVQVINGKEVAFDGGTAMDFGNPYSLTLGSGSFIDGFEEGLVGVIPENTYTYSTDTSLEVEKDSYVHVIFTGTYMKDGVDTPYKLTNGKNPKLINLSKCLYGNDFVEGLVGAHVGDQVEFDCWYDADGNGTKDLVSFNVEVVDLLKLNPHEVEATFPEVYPQNTDLAGQTVKFYVWVESVETKTPAEINDELWEELNYTTKESDVLNAFRKEYRQAMQDQRDSDCDTATLSEIWPLLIEKVQVKKYPAGEVESIAASIKEEADYYYESAIENGYSFDSYEAFVIYNYNLTDEDAESFDADKYFQEIAEENVKSKLIAWYLCGKYGISITQKELSAAVQNFLQTQADSYSQSYGQSVTADQMAQMYAEQYGENYVTNYVEETLLSEQLNVKLLEKVTVNYGVKDEAESQ